MLGVRLDPETEEALAAHAERTGTTKSAIVREFVREGLSRSSHEAWLREAGRNLAAHNRDQDDIDSDFDD